MSTGEPLLTGLIYANKSIKDYDDAGNLRLEKSGNREMRYSYNYLLLPERIETVVRKDEVVAEGTDNFNVLENDSESIALITRYEYDKNGNMKVQVDPSNNRAEYESDHMGRLKNTVYYGVQDEYGNNLARLEDKIEYDWAGNVTGTKTKAVYPNGEEKIYSPKEYYYNGKGELLVSVDKVYEDGIQKDAVNAYAYDNAGRMIAQASPESFSHIAPGNQNPVEKYCIDNARSRIGYTYDLMGRLKTKEFFGQTYKYDMQLGQMQQAEDSFVIEAYAYDANDNIVKEVDGTEYKKASKDGRSVDDIIKNAIGTTYTYTLSNKLETVKYPKEASGGKEFSQWYEYDGLGNIIKEKSLKGISGIGNMCEYTALTDTSYRQNTDGTITYTSTTKVENPGELNAYAQGEMTKIWKNDINGNTIEERTGKNQVFREYNGLGLEKSSTKEVDRYTEGGKEVVVNSEQKTFYDVRGNKKIEKSGSGVFKINDFDVFGRVVESTTGRRDKNKDDNETVKGDLLESVTTRQNFDVNGNIRFKYDGNGFETEYTYDDLNRQKAIIYRYYAKNDPGEKELLLEKIKEYDLDGNPIEEKERLTDLKGGRSLERAHKSYMYDGLGRIVEKNDINGNKKIAYESIEYNENSDQEYSYDAAGKRIQFSYDVHRNHTKTIDPLGNCTEQVYDAGTNVSSKIDGEGNFNFNYYDVLNRL